MQNTTFLHGMMYIEKSVHVFRITIFNTRDKNY